MKGDERSPWNQGRACPRVLALTQYAYHQDRITTPLKRSGKRGEGKFEPISWDDAYDLCEVKLKEIREKNGAESVIFVQGNRAGMLGARSLFWLTTTAVPTGANLGLSGQSCYTPRLGAMKATIGDFCVLDASQFSEMRYEDPEWVVPKVIIVWGQNPPPTCPDGFYGHWIVDCMKRGSQIISVDPRNTWISTRAKYHLQIRPGTDGALALGMLNVIINEGPLRQNLCGRMVLWFLMSLLKECSNIPPTRFPEITWIQEHLIIEAARLYATSKPAAIQWGVPICMNPQATSVAQAISNLWSITGNIDIPGGNVIARPSHGVTTYPYSTEELVRLYGKELVDKLNKVRIGCDKYPMVKRFSWLGAAGCSNRADRLRQAIPN